MPMQRHSRLQGREFLKKLNIILDKAPMPTAINTWVSTDEVVVPVGIYAVTLLLELS